MLLNVPAKRINSVLLPAPHHAHSLSGVVAQLEEPQEEICNSGELKREKLREIVQTGRTGVWARGRREDGAMRRERVMAYSTWCEI